MPLLIELKANDKIIINGAVIENTSNTSTKLMLHNQASILREREILAEEEATTPASRVYYDLQCAYVFKEHREQHMTKFRLDLGDYIAACPSAMPIANDINDLVDAEKFYKALKKSKELIIHEANTFKDLHDRLLRLTEDGVLDADGSEEDENDNAAKR